MAKLTYIVYMASILFLSTVSTKSLAHHSYVAEFGSKNPVEIEGVVKEVWFKNPHIRYYLAVTNDKGEEVLWDTRGLSPAKLIRLGWTKNTIKAGDRVKMYGYVGRTNKSLLSIIEITLADGRALSSKSSSYDLVEEK